MFVFKWGLSILNLIYESEPRLNSCTYNTNPLLPILLWSYTITHQYLMEILVSSMYYPYNIVGLNLIPILYNTCSAL